ncbi:MAG: hypothetical protein DMF56_11300 [Acidobacteria bacterium]|nr:MAG: hypothetical protein DMF56_11300 [Acidobacteriota bacterium]
MNILIALTLLAASHRNPFQYVEPQVKVERRALSPPAKAPAPVEEPRRAESPPLHEDAPPKFPYQLIGRFGLVRDPIVAFVGNGQVITARIGDTIDDTFVVRGIGVESVDIGYVNRPETLRLQLDGSV